jgi:hypothetical protein
MTLTAVPSCMLTATVQTLDDAPPVWCIFEHWTADEMGALVLQFIGACRLTDAFKTATARSNTEWCKLMKPETSLYIRITAIGDKSECLRDAARQVSNAPPRCNLYGLNLHGSQRRIKCSNGQTYDTQQQAAEALNVSQSAISAHLNGRGRAVGGYTFSYEDA